MTWSERIKALRKEFEGKKVSYEGSIYNIAFVDYNGIIHIDKPGKFTKTTAVYTTSEARKNIII